MKTPFPICVKKEIKGTQTLYRLGILRNKHLEKQPLEYSIVSIVLKNPNVGHIKHVSGFHVESSQEHNAVQIEANFKLYLGTLVDKTVRKKLVRS